MAAPSRLKLKLPKMTPNLKYLWNKWMNFCIYALHVEQE